MNYYLSCSACHDVIIKSSDDSVKIRAKVIIHKENCTFAVCKGCGKEIAIPLTLDRDMMKSMEQPKNPRLYLWTKK